MTADELDQACEKMTETAVNYENDIIAKMIGIRAPYAGDKQFVKLLAVVARAILDIKSGNFRSLQAVFFIRTDLR